MHKEEEKAAELLSSGKLDPKQLRKLAESRDGQRVRSLLGDEKALAEAVQKGDAAALQGALQTLLATPEGRRLFQQLGGMMGKG
jgi:hypothetical protein